MRPRGYDGVPDVLPALGRHVDFPAGLADEADAQQQRVHSGYDGLSAGHVWKRVTRQVTIGERGQYAPGVRAGEVERGQPAGDVRHLYVPAGPDRPPGEPLFDGLDVARGGRQKEAVVPQPRDRSVVDDDPGVVAHHAVAAASDAQVGSRVRVNLVEQGGSIAADDFQFPQRTHVDDAHAFPHRTIFARRFGVCERAPPVAEQPHVRAEFAVAVMQRGTFFGMISPAGQHPERDGLDGRARRRGPRRGQFMTGLPGAYPQRGRGAHPPLAGTHAERAVAFQRFDFVEAFGHAIGQVGVGEVFAQTHELLLLDLDMAGFRGGGRGGRRCGCGFAQVSGLLVFVRPDSEVQALRSVQAGLAALVEHREKIRFGVEAGDLARAKNVRWQGARHHASARFVVAQRAATLRHEPRGRGTLACQTEQVARDEPRGV